MSAKAWVTMDDANRVKIFYGGRPKEFKLGWFEGDKGDFVRCICPKYVDLLGLKLRPGDCVEYEITFTPTTAEK